MLRNVGGVRQCLSQMGLIAAISLLATGPAVAQGNVVVGTVVSRPDGQPIPAAVVMIDGTSLTAVTNAAGRFRIENVPAARTTLVVKAQGFLDGRVSDIQTGGASAPITIELDRTPNFMEQVQVTATKTDLSVGDVAAQTDIVSRATIDSRGDQSLTQAIAHVPGAIVSTQLGIFETVLLRGMPRGDLEFTHTLLMVDGVPQTLSTNGARVVALPINDANNIEVVRGPNSALYGRGAVGGAVNLRTADPTPDHQFGFDFTGGQFDMVKGLGRASGPLKQWGGYYVSAAKEQNHGYYVNKTTDDYTDGNWALFGKLTFTHDSKSFGSVSFNRVDSDNSTPTNEPIIDGQLLHVLNPRFDRLTNMNIPGPNYSQGESRLTLNYTRELSPMFKITEVFGYRDVRLQFIDDGDFIGTPFDFEANTISMYPFSQLNNEDIIYQELRAELTPKKVGRMKNTAIVGWSYEWNRSSSASDFIFDDPDLFGFTINYLNPVIPPESTWQHDGTSRFSHSKITGIFGQYMIEPAPRLIVTAGGRYDRLDLDTSANSGPTIVYDFDAFSPKVSATVKLAGLGNDSRPTVNVYGAYSQAFLPPRRPSTLTPADVELNLQPEDISNYEAGVKGSLANGRVSFDAAVFHMTEDGVVLNTFQGPFLIPTNSGQLRYNGVETGLGYAVSTKASAYVNASFYRSKFGDFVIQSEDGDEVLTGNRVPIAPNYVVNWGLTARPVPSIEAVLNVKHIGDMAANNDNSFIIDPANLVDAAVTWRRGPLRVTLSAHNLFNEEYYWNADGDVADPGRPRQVLVTVSVLAK